MTQQTFYDILGLPRDASVEQINKAFREKALLLHPDKNKTDPEAVQKFKALTQAYQVLTDAQRRAKYDATLPPLPVEPEQLTDPVQLWARAGELFFEQSERFTPAVDAMRISIPLTIEDDALLIVGMKPDQQRLIGYIDSAATHNKIRRIISDLYGKPLDFRVISGTSLEEWERLRGAEEKVLLRRMVSTPAVTNGAAPDATAPPPATLPENDGVWDELLEHIMRAWSAQTTRSLPQTRARFVLEQVPQVSRAEDIARATGAAEEHLQRNLARALDRMANLTGIDSGIVALEYLRFRARVTGGVA